MWELSSCYALVLRLYEACALDVRSCCGTGTCTCETVAVRAVTLLRRTLVSNAMKSW